MSSSDESSYGGGPSNVSKFPLHDVCDSPDDDVEALKKYLFLKPNGSGKKTNGFGFDDSSDDDDDDNNNNNNSNNNDDGEGGKKEGEAADPTDDPNVFILSPYINTRDDDENTPLHLAILRGNVNIVKTLLMVANDNPDNITITKRCDGSFPIHCIASLAAMAGTTEKCTSMLLALSAHPHFDHTLKDDSGHTPLYLLTLAPSAPLISTLLTLILERSGGKPEVVTEAVNARSHRTGLRPLHAAAKVGSLEAAKVLVERGNEGGKVEVNVSDR